MSSQSFIVLFYRNLMYNVSETPYKYKYMPFTGNTMPFYNRTSLSANSTPCSSDTYIYTSCRNGFFRIQLQYYTVAAWCIRRVEKPRRSLIKRIPCAHFIYLSLDAAADVSAPFQWCKRVAD